MFLGFRNSAIALFFHRWLLQMITRSTCLLCFGRSGFFPTEFSLFPIAHNGPATTLPWASPKSCIASSAFIFVLLPLSSHRG